MMTTLQIVLAIVGVSLIAIIVIYNVLQERKFRKEADRMFSHKREDIMLGESVRTEASKRRADTHIQLTDSVTQASEARHAVDEAEAVMPAIGYEHERVSSEPVTSILSSLELLPGRDPDPEPPRPMPTNWSTAPAVPDAMPKTTPASALADGDMPPVVSVVEAGVTETEPETSPILGSGLDEGTEFIARLKFAAPLLANFGPLLSVLRRIGKPMRAYGCRTDGNWEALSSHPRNVYAQVEFGLQLADRGGAVSQDQLDAFCRALYEFAAEEGGAVSCPSKEEALGLARDLDLFCMDVDVLIGLNVVSADSRPFTSEAMHSHAQEARLTLESDGTIHARDDFGHTLVTLANQEDEPFPRDGRGLTTHGVTLLFDVPRVADGLAVFDRMTRLGFDLAWRLEGRLVDDNGRSVSEDSLTRDRARLSQFFARMEARGIPAGGERALRLFV